MSEKGPTLTLNAPPATATSPQTQKILEDLNKLTTDELFALQAHAKWCEKRHKHQAPPKGDWTIWLMLAHVLVRILVTSNI